MTPGRLASLEAHELALVNEVEAAWGRFAAGGDPGAVGGVEWPESIDEAHLVLHVDPSLGGDFHRAQCDQWDRLIP